MLVPLFAPAIFLCVAPVPVMVFIFFGPPASTTKKIVVTNSVVDPDSHSFLTVLDPDLYWECGNEYRSIKFAKNLKINLD